MTRILAQEVGNYNIRVNCIAPGPFISPINELNSQEIEKIIKSNAIKKLLHPKKLQILFCFCAVIILQQ